MSFSLLRASLVRRIEALPTYESSLRGIYERPTIEALRDKCHTSYCIFEKRKMSKFARVKINGRLQVDVWRDIFNKFHLCRDTYNILKFRVINLFYLHYELISSSSIIIIRDTFSHQYRTHYRAELRVARCSLDDMKLWWVGTWDQFYIVLTFQPSQEVCSLYHVMDEVDNPTWVAYPFVLNKLVNEFYETSWSIGGSWKIMCRSSTS